jgi:transcriptional regulator with XRE-family HTH domain
MSEALAGFWPHRQPQSLQENVTAVVQALAAIAGLNQDDLAERMDVSASTISGKMSGRRAWKLEELTTLAGIFGVKPDLFLQPPASIFGPALRVEQDKTNAWAPRGSNPQPADYQTQTGVLVDLDEQRARRRPTATSRLLVAAPRS